MTASGEPDPARVEALFDALLDLGPDERATELDAACVGDAALREAVERLLAHDRNAPRGFLAPLGALPAEALQERAALATTVEEGSRGDEVSTPTRLGRFTVRRRLGEGGMGTVYVGHDDVLDREVALKLLHRDAETHAWLRREGQALARIAHPNVVHIHELGEHEGRVFLAMELVPGPTLRAFLEERRPPFAEVLRLFLEAGRGLAAVHDAGLVHRDFKPANVIVGADGRARVVDFGLARFAERPDPDEPAHSSPERATILASPLTRAGAILGTPAYMALEQLRGQPASPESDQFGFCVALHRAVYGTAPFPAQSLDELARKIASGDLARPPDKPDVPRWLEPILRRGLAAHPSRRFPSMRALLEAIEAHLPRDPGLDPTVVRRELLIVRGGALALMVGFAVVASRRLHSATPERLTLNTLAFLAAMGAVIALRWRKLGANRYGKRAAGLVLGTVVGMLAHRVVALELRLSLAQMVVEDMMLLAAIFCVVTVTVDKRVALLAGIATVGVVAGILAPDRAPFAFVGVALATLVLLTRETLRPG